MYQESVTGEGIADFGDRGQGSGARDCIFLLHPSFCLLHRFHYPLTTFALINATPFLGVALGCVDAASQNIFDSYELELCLWSQYQSSVSGEVLRKTLEISS
jgi:hypothetical protein